MPDETFAAGHVFFRPGDPGDRAYLLHDGQVEIVGGPSGSSSRLALFEPGEVFGEMALTLGAYLKRSPARSALVPAVPVTVTSAAPGVPDGEIAVTEVGEFTTKLVALLAPKWTALMLRNPVPVIVTAVPPPAGPVLGASFLTMGGGR